MNTPLVNLHDHERAARAVLSEAAWACLSGGAADEITLARNVSAWQAWALAPQVLQDLRGGHTRWTLLGKTWPMPLLVAPMAHMAWAHPEAEQGMALAAAAQGCGMVLSHQTSTALQDVAQDVVAEPERGPLWFQMYWMNDRGRQADLLCAAEQAGYEALVITVDAPVQGVRDRERRHAGPRPAQVRPFHWQTPMSMSEQDPCQGLCQGLADMAPTWSDVAWLIAQTRLPVLLKGITQADDARQAMAIGAAGIIVSNHGGRVLDTLPASAECLPRVAEAVRSIRTDATVLVDGGIRRGTDLFKALALGADAALIGRPALWGLAHGGARGAAHVLRLMRDEFEAAMVLCGCAHPAQICARHVQPMSPVPFRQVSE